MNWGGLKLHNDLIRYYFFAYVLFLALSWLTPLNRLAFRAVPQGLCGCHAYKATAGWRFGNLIDGTQAEYVLVPDAQANLAPIPGF